MNPSISNNVIDLTQQYRTWYAASDEPEEVTFGPVNGLGVSGQGEPGGAAYMKALQPLIAVANATIDLATNVNVPFVMPPLEGRWWVEDERPWSEVPRQEWWWHLFLRLPDALPGGTVDEAREIARAADKTHSVSRVQLVTFTEGLSVQMLHRGHYGEEPKTLGRMDEFCEKCKLTANGLHHEIYLSDLRETDPAKMRTILRHPVRPIRE
jgi:hypothetical protein